MSGEKKLIQTAFIRSFLFPILAAVVVVGAYRVLRPDRFSDSSGRPAVQENQLPGLPKLGSIPDFSLTEASGKTITRADFEGKVWIANFIFTRCSGICPLMSGKMNLMIRELEGQEEIRFVSFSVDPEYDTPEVLKRYAERFKAPPGRWFFLTGDKQQIYQLSIQHFHLGVGEISPEEREALDQSIRHSSKFVLIDRDGQIRGYYDTDDQEMPSKLAVDARSLLKQPLNKSI